MWSLRTADDRLARAHAQRLGVAEVLGRILAGRSVPLDLGERFLNPSLREDMPDPSSLADMDRAVGRVVRTVEAGKPVGIFGDYDVDGAASTALLGRYLTGLGLRVLTHIPDRMTEGYGPNIAALRALAAEGADVIVTVDCGTAATSVLAEAAGDGLDVVVLDHHETPDAPPPTAGHVNPKQAADRSGLDHLAAVGVTFFFVVALNRALRDRGFFSGERQEPDLRDMLDLVALGTVCDVVPLVGINRAFVLRGQEVMGRRGNAGLTALCDIAGIKERPTSVHLGFQIGPRINAGGRIGRSGLAAALLGTSDAGEAAKLARELDALNKERQAMEAAIVREAVAAAAVQVDRDEAPVIVLAREAWHPGVLGIVAGRLKDRFQRPAFVFGIDRNGRAVGSGRSVPGVDLGTAVLKAVEAGAAIKGGGHTMAAGATLDAAQVTAFQAFLAERLAADTAIAAATRTLDLDGALAVSGATRELADLVERAGPFGAGNPEPLFAVPNARLVKQDVVGQGHVRLIVSDTTGKRLKAIAFRCKDSDLGQLLLNERDRPVHLAGRLRADNWRNQRGVQFEIEDAARPAD